MRLSKIISYFFHPLLLPTYGLFLIFHIGGIALWIPNSVIQLILYILTISLTFLLPLLSSIFLLKSRQLSTLEMHTREERIIPYLVTAVFYSCESYLMMRMEIPTLLKIVMLGATALIVSVLIINFFWKISAHMAGIGGLCGMMIAISSRLQVNIHYILIPLFLSAGLIGFARLKLNEHNPAQVYCGFLLGVITQVALFV